VRVTGWVSATQTVTVNRALTNTWPSGAKYHLLVDTRLAEWLQVLAEVSGATTSATLRAILFAWPDDADRLIRAVDIGPFQLDNTGVQGAAGEIQETDYYHTAGVSRRCRGYMGAKLSLEALADGDVSLWAGLA